MKILFLILVASATSFAETGILKTFSFEKGYGFIKIPNSNDIFVHVSQIEAAFLQDIKAGECLSFDIVSKLDGRKAAENLSRISCSDLEVTCN